MRPKKIMVWVSNSIPPPFMVLNNSKVKQQSAKPVVTQDDALVRGSLQAWHSSDDNPLEHHIMSPCVVSGKHYSLLPASLPNSADQTNSKSIFSSNHTDFLPSAIISMVYLLTERFSKSRSRVVCSLEELMMSVCCGGKHLTPLGVLFIWKSLVLPNLDPIHARLMQNKSVI